MPGHTRPVLPAAPSHEFKLPNVRKMFIPDPGMVIVDADLAGADAQVVAWEADDADLKAAFRRGESVHLKNGEAMFGDRFTKAVGHHKDPGTPKGRLYDALKRAVHATNYLGSAHTLHLNPAVRWPLHECVAFQERWFKLHPGVRQWHERIKHSVYSSRSVRNQFGYRIIYFDRVESVLSQAVAWGPQSTVAEVCFRGALQLRKLPGVEILLQVHDSVVFQIPIRKHEPGFMKQVEDHLMNPVPYADPLIIKWGIAASPKSWGECK